MATDDASSSKCMGDSCEVLKRACPESLMIATPNQWSSERIEIKQHCRTIGYCGADEVVQSRQELLERAAARRAITAAHGFGDPGAGVSY